MQSRCRPRRQAESRARPWKWNSSCWQHQPEPGTLVQSTSGFGAPAVRLFVPSSKALPRDHGQPLERFFRMCTRDADGDNPGMESGKSGAALSQICRLPRCELQKQNSAKARPDGRDFRNRMIQSVHLCPGDANAAGMCLGSSFSIRMWVVAQTISRDRRLSMCDRSVRGFRGQRPQVRQSEMLAHGELVTFCHTPMIARRRQATTWVTANITIIRWRLCYL
jgi:hypothetical protein